LRTNNETFNINAFSDLVNAYAYYMQLRS